MIYDWCDVFKINRARPQIAASHLRYPNPNLNLMVLASAFMFLLCFRIIVYILSLAF